MSSGAGGMAGGPPRRGPTGTVVLPAVAPGTPAPSPRLALTHWPVPEEVVAGLPVRPRVRPWPLRDAEFPFAGQGSAVDWLRRAAEANRVDKDTEARKVKLGRWAVAMLILGFCTIWIYGLGVIFVVVACMLYLRINKLSKLDLEDRKLEVFSSTVLAFAPELNAKRPLSVKLDFSAYRRHPSEALGDLKTFTQCWLELDLPLIDGSTLSASVTTLVSQKERRKTKYTRVRSRLVEQVAVSVTAPGGKGFKPASPGGFSGGRAAGLILKRARIEPQRALFVWATEPSIRVEGRRGSNSSTENILDSGRLLAALVASYKLVASSERSAA